jgi:hypothetical protein
MTSITTPDLSLSQPDLSVSQPELSASQPDLSASQPELSASLPELSTSQPEKAKPKVPYMKLKPLFRSNRATIEFAGYLNHEKELGDELIEIDMDAKDKDKYGSNLTFIDTYGKYLLLAKYYDCNILSTFLMQNTKLPVFYMTVIYEKQYVSGFLLSYYVYFTLDEGSIKSINMTTKLLNRELYGKYTLEFVTEPNYIENIIKYTKPSDEQAEKFRNLFKPVTLDFYPSKNIIIKKHMKDLCENDIFKSFIKLGLQKRDDERNTDGYNCSFKIPKRIFNLKEIKENPNIVNTILDNEEGRSSDNTDYED